MKRSLKWSWLALVGGPACCRWNGLHGQAQKQNQASQSLKIIKQYKLIYPSDTS
jgi:hypothetical protein